MQQPKTVLLMDDDPDDLEMLQDALAAIGNGHDVVTAEDGKEGLHLLGEMNGSGNLPCLIVLDLNMPNMNGRDTFLALKKIPEYAAIPVVIFSTSSSKLDKLFFEKHETPYFIKPVNYQRLIDTAAQMMQHCTRH